MRKSPFTEMRLSVDAYITSVFSLRALKKTAVLPFLMKSTRADTSAIWSDSTSFIRDVSQMGLDLKESSTFVKSQADVAPRGREAVLDESPRLNIAQCAHMHICLRTFVRMFLGYYLFTAQPVGDGQQRGQRGMGRPPLCLMCHPFSVILCVWLLCIVSWLLKIDSVRAVRKNTKTLRAHIR